jgi:hypothetical protein
MAYLFNPFSTPHLIPNVHVKHPLVHKTWQVQSAKNCTFTFLNCYCSEEGEGYMCGEY